MSRSVSAAVDQPVAHRAHHELAGGLDQRHPAGRAGSGAGTLAAVAPEPAADDHHLAWSARPPRRALPRRLMLAARSRLSRSMLMASLPQSSARCVAARPNSLWRAGMMVSAAPWPSEGHQSRILLGLAGWGVVAGAFWRGRRRCRGIMQLAAHSARPGNRVGGRRLRQQLWLGPRPSRPRATERMEVGMNAPQVSRRDYV